MATNKYESNNFPISNEISESISQTATTQQEVNQEFKKDLQDKILFFEKNWNLENLAKLNTLKGNLINFEKKLIGSVDLITKPLKINLSEPATNFDEIWFNEHSYGLTLTVFLKVPAKEFSKKSKQLINMLIIGAYRARTESLRTIEIIDNQNLSIDFYNINESPNNDIKFDVWGVNYRTNFPDEIQSDAFIVEKELNTRIIETQKISNSFSEFIEKNLLSINTLSASTTNSDNKNGADETDNLIVSDSSLESISKTAKYQQAINEELKNRLKNIQFNLENLKKIQNKINDFNFRIIKHYSQTELAVAIDLSTAKEEEKVTINLNHSMNNYNELALKLYRDNECWWFHMPTINKINVIQSSILNSDFTLGALNYIIKSDLELDFFFENINDLTDWKLDIYGVNLKTYNKQ